MSKKLTKTLVDSTKAPATGDTFLWCPELQGFGVRIQASGRKTYVVRYRTRDASRTQRKLTISRCSDMPPEKARELARKAFAQVAEGGDPAAERKPSAAPEATKKTVEKLFEGYVASMRARDRVLAPEVERALLKCKANAADAIGRHRPAADITPTDVVDHISTFYHAGHRGAANKQRSYICAAYNWALKSANDYTVPVEQRVDYGLSRNPAADVAKDHGAMKTRDRHLSASELRQLWLATAPGELGFAPDTAACLRLLICCGQRVQETLRICGSEVDLEAGLWKMPAHKTKGRKKMHAIPLPKQAIEVLKGQIAAHGDGYLFPPRTGAAGDSLSHMSVMHAVRRWQDSDCVDMPAFQTRDIRRTWKSRANDAGVDRFTRDLIQQHAKGDIGSKVYDQADYVQQMREAMDKWSAWLDRVTGDPAQVIKLTA